MYKIVCFMQSGYLFTIIDRMLEHSEGIPLNIYLSYCLL